MKALPPEARIQNRSARKFCIYCLDDGFIPVETRPAARTVHNGPNAGGSHDELGPCPMCEAGFQVEFQKGAPWGRDGFWQGRERADVQPAYQGQGFRVPPALSQRELLRELTARIGLPVAPVSAAGAASRSSAETPPAAPAIATSTSRPATGEAFGEVPA